MPHLSRLPTVPIHLDDHLANVATVIPIAPPLPVPSTPGPATTSASSPSTVALSFAFDSVQKTLNVVIKDERSGEIVRKIEYTHIPHDVHRPEKLNGLLLNQFA